MEARYPGVLPRSLFPNIYIFSPSGGMRWGVSCRLAAGIQKCFGVIGSHSGIERGLARVELVSYDIGVWILEGQPRCGTAHSYEDLKIPHLQRRLYYYEKEKRKKGLPFHHRIFNLVFSIKKFQCIIDKGRSERINSKYCITMLTLLNDIKNYELCGYGTQCADLFPLLHSLSTFFLTLPVSVFGNSLTISTSLGTYPSINACPGNIGENKDKP